MTPVYTLVESNIIESPIIVSCPHSGVQFPEEVKKQLISKHIAKPEDTDWHVDQLYSFVPQFGIKLLKANFSRYVIDLNRHPDGESLYADDRSETSLVPIKTFGLENLYESNSVPTPSEIERRKKLYYLPYHQKLEQLLAEAKAKFGYALLFEAHSIRHFVPSLNPEVFPDLILGDQDGKTCLPKITKLACDVLSNNTYAFTFSHNHPFKGGHLTRSMAKPDEKIYSMQLEMCQKIYMNEETFEFMPQKAETVISLLKTLFKALTKSFQ